MVINPVQADADVIVNPSTIVINDVQDKSESSTTFHIIPNIEGLTKIKISTLGLTNETEQNNNQPTLQVNQVEFTPAEFTDLPVGERQAVQVSISGITGYGDWVGEVIISWSGKTAGEMAVPIEAHMATVPDFGANSSWDYLKVMLWGFGAEASSSEVSGLIKEWVIPLAGGKQS